MVNSKYHLDLLWFRASNPSASENKQRGIAGQRITLMPVNYLFRKFYILINQSCEEAIQFFQVFFFLMEWVLFLPVASVCEVLNDKDVASVQIQRC